MSEDKKPFAVHDRRLFEQDGSLREETAGSGAAVADAPRPAAQDPPAAEVDFASFILSLAAQAGMLLGVVASEPGAEARVDLAAARSIISILEMLREKTEGRRTPEEDQILEGILYDLRMSYVARTRAGRP